MKLLLTSVDAVIDQETDKPFGGIEEVLHGFEQLEDGNQVIVLSRNQYKLDKLPASLTGVLMTSRGSRAPIQFLMEHHEDFNNISKILVLAANDGDYLTAVNSKVRHIGALYAQKNNPGSKAYQYGMQMAEVSGVKLFLERFTGIANPWYYHLAVDETTNLYALTNANTLGNGRARETMSISQHFKACLKDGENRNKALFMTYFLSSIYEMSDISEKVDIWGIYPSSGTSTNTDLEHFKEVVRTSFGVRHRPPLFIRHTASTKRSAIDATDRVLKGCDNQFETMHLNPEYKGKLEDKAVCVIDDFTTYGTSCEAARHLLLSAGAKEVLFVALGRFGNKYYKYDYAIEGDVFTPNYTYSQRGHIVLYGEFNAAADNVFLKSLQGVTR